MTSLTTPDTSEKIPSVEFNPEALTSNGVGIEMFSLESLRSRLASLGFNAELPHRIKFHILIYIQEGTGTHFIDFKHYSFRAGSFISINKNQVHSFEFINELRGYMVLFTDEFKDSVRSNIRLPNLFSTHAGAHQAPVLTVSNGLKKSSELLLGEIENLTDDETRDPLLTQLLFSALLLKVYHDRPTIISSDITEVRAAKFLKFLSLIEQRYVTSKDASEYAESMGMTYKSLNQLCKAAVNQTPKQLINAHVTLEAKRRLVIEDIQIKQLSFELGFDEVSNFTKYFKKQTALSPKQFKNSLKG